MRRGGLFARAKLIGVSRRLKRTSPGWTVRVFDPVVDLAPPVYEELGLAHSCDGQSHDDPRLRSATRTPASRGWGPGWPNCQYSKWVTIVRRDGLRLSVRRELAELYALLYDETERLGYDLIAGWCWGTACRAIRGSSNPSNHSWGLADDKNAPENPMGPRTGRIRKFPAVIALWKRFMFGWGGDYTNRADDMHFEFMGTPADAAEMTRRARLEFGGSDEGGFLDMLTKEQQQQVYDWSKGAYSNSFVVLKNNRTGKTGPVGVDQLVLKLAIDAGIVGGPDADFSLPQD